MILHDFFRSTAAWRVRLALHIKGVPFTQTAHHLRRNEQRDPAYLRLNPHGLVPALQLDDGTVLTQSLAIIAYLEETFPAPSLLPGGPVLRAQARGVALAIACEIHPVQNLRVLRRVAALGQDEAGVNAWGRETVQTGLDACEAQLAGGSTRFCVSETPSLADICLVPQLANARRFGCELSAWPRLLAIEAACEALPAFRAAHPSAQPDAE